MTAYRAVRLTAVAAAILIFIVAILAIALFEPGAMWNRIIAYVFAVQRDLHRELAAAMRSVQGNAAGAAWSLAGLGFLYGVFHAAGPGHGKIVISTYLATHESRLRWGVALSVLSSLLQGATALGAVGLTVAALLSRSAKHRLRVRERELRTGGSSRPLPGIPQWPPPAGAPSRVER
jgi:nickel/cobalt exporter